ncbi:hypothetical protein VTJ04DRAFT_9596 [Mycothermus thermophilus]|uniref:uncharacterized protein n=1 Tax=Humicola insolens TaxID=85995 RepID=UPI0037437BE5
MTKDQMDKEAAARIQSAAAKKGDDVGPDSFPARAQSAADKNANANNNNNADQAAANDEAPAKSDTPPGDPPATAA